MCIPSRVPKRGPHTLFAHSHNTIRTDTRCTDAKSSRWDIPLLRRNLTARGSSLHTAPRTAPPCGSLWAMTHHRRCEPHVIRVETTPTRTCARGVASLSPAWCHHSRDWCSTDPHLHHVGGRGGVCEQNPEASRVCFRVTPPPPPPTPALRKPGSHTRGMSAFASRNRGRGRRMTPLEWIESSRIDVGELRLATLPGQGSSERLTIPGDNPWV